MPIPFALSQIKSLPPHLQEIVSGYLEGYYLMADDIEEGLGWYSAPTHTLMPLGTSLHIPKSLKRVLNQNRFTTKCSTAIEAVIDGCRNRETTWISEELVAIYQELAKYGVVQTFEAWQGDTLAGGVLGLVLGGAFIGESMFTAIEDGGKVALVRLCHHLAAHGFALFDAQLQNPHLERFGSFEVETEKYVAQLKAAAQLPCVY